MKQTHNRPSAVALFVIVVLGIALATQVRAFTSDIGRSLAMITSAAQPTPPGPEADPYIRHAPGGYDFERELPRMCRDLLREPHTRQAILGL